MDKHKKNNKIRNIISTHLNNNLKEYMLVIIVLLIGVIIGIIVINNVDDNQKNEIQNYINGYTNSINECKTVDKINILKSAFLNNLILVISLTFIGSTVIGIPIVYVIVAYKGFCLSYTIASLIAVLGTWKGMLFSIFSLCLQNLIYIPCIIALAVSGIRLYKSIIKDKRRENIKLEILRHIMFSSLIGILLLLGTLVEAYISSNLIIFFSKYL